MSLLKKFKLLKFAKAMLYVEHKLLGLGEEYLYIEPDEKEGLFVLNEAIEGGNFGYSDTRQFIRSFKKMFGVTPDRFRKVEQQKSYEKQTS